MKYKTLAALAAGVAVVVSAPIALAQKKEKTIQERETATVVKEGKKTKTSYKTKIEEIIKLFDYYEKTNPFGGLNPFIKFQRSTTTYGLWRLQLMEGKSSGGGKFFGIMFYEPGSRLLTSEPRLLIGDFKCNEYGQVDGVFINTEKDGKKYFKGVKLTPQQKEEWTKIFNAAIDKFYDSKKDEIKKLKKVFTEQESIENLIENTLKNNLPSGDAPSPQLVSYTSKEN